MIQTLASSIGVTGSVQVRFFGRIADHFGRAVTVEIPAGGCSLPWFKTELARQVEGGAEALAEQGLRMAVDHLIVGQEAWIGSGQEVAFLSMFSGG